MDTQHYTISITNTELINLDDPDYMEDEFYDPGGRSALRAGNRCHPCPTCQEPNRLTAADVKRHYQCDQCADRAERGY